MFPWYLATIAHVSVGAMAAVVQGMDETVVNGAQLFFVEQFGLTNNTLLQGLVNGKCILATKGTYPRQPQKNKHPN